MQQTNKCTKYCGQILPMFLDVFVNFETWGTLYWGRGGPSKNSQNPGIAKKRGKGGEPCQDFWQIWHSAQNTPQSDKSNLKSYTLSPQKDHSLTTGDHLTKKWPITPKNCNSRTFVAKMSPVASMRFCRQICQDWGAGNSNQSWQCQDFESFWNGHPPLPGMFST